MAADVASAHAPSTLSSSEILQKLRAYRGVPKTPSSSAEKPFDPTDDDDTDSRTTSELSRKPPQQHHHHHHHHHRSTPYSSTSIGTFSSSPPSSRVDRYQFEDDEAAAAAAAVVGRHVQYPKSRSTRPSSLGTVPEARCLGGSGAVPSGGRLRGRRLQSTTTTASALVQSHSGDTSSTETLVTPVGKPRGARQSNVSFVDNVGGYLSSQVRFVGKLR